jgi:hypothetical protein
MKKEDFRKLSLVKCIDCGNMIKANLANRKTTTCRCYKCHCKFEHGRGHTINTKPRTKRIAGNLPVKAY